MSKNNNNNKGDGGSEKKTASVTVVLRVNMHCDSCASKIVKSVRAFQGVETVKAESETGKVTVTGVVDPAKLREQLEVKTKKKVELVSPQPNKEKEKDNKNKDSKDKNTSNEDKNKEKKKAKEAPVTTVVLKVDFHCEGCIEKIQKTASKTKGVSGLSLDHEKQLVTVKGTMDVKKLVEIVAPAKKDKDNGNEKEKESGDKKKRGGGRGKDNAGDKGGEGMNTMEHVAAQPAHGSMYDPDEDGYSNQFYAVARDLLSDENPNCVVM